MPDRSELYPAIEKTGPRSTVGARARLSGDISYFRPPIAVRFRIFLIRVGSYQVDSTLHDTAIYMEKKEIRLDRMRKLGRWCLGISVSSGRPSPFSYGVFMIFGMMYQRSHVSPDSWNYIATEEHLPPSTTDAGAQLSGNIRYVGRSASLVPVVSLIVISVRQGCFVAPDTSNYRGRQRERRPDLHRRQGRDCLEISAGDVPSYMIGYIPGHRANLAGMFCPL